jgi:hypothetical protein
MENQNLNPNITTPKSNYKQHRKITLQPLTNSPNIKVNSNELISPTNNLRGNRRSNINFSPINNANIVPNPLTSQFNPFSHSPNFISPRHGNCPRPIIKPPTLFDFISTPIKKSPKKLETTEQMSIDVANVAQINADKHLFKPNVKDLGLIVEKALDADEMYKLKVVAKFYAELILSKLKLKNVIYLFDPFAHALVSLVLNMQTT